MESVQLYPTPSGGSGVTQHWSITVEPRGYGPSGGSVVMVTPWEELHKLHEEEVTTIKMLVFKVQ